MTPLHFADPIIYLRYILISNVAPPSTSASSSIGYPLGYATFESKITYARWTQQQNNNVPEPNALMLLGIGLLSQRWLRTRGKRVLV